MHFVVMKLFSSLYYQQWSMKIYHSLILRHDWQHSALCQCGLIIILALGEEIVCEGTIIAMPKSLYYVPNHTLEIEF